MPQMTKDANLSEVSEQSQVANFSHVTVETVKAELVRMHQSSAGEIQAEDVELKMSASANINSARVSTKSSAIAALQSVEVTTENSAVGAAQAERMSLSGVAGAVMAGSVELDHSHVGILAGREVRGEQIKTMVLLAGKVEGNVTTLMDTRSALIAGLVGGLFAGIMLLLGRSLFGRK
jgi:hypothetical protein